MKFYREMLLQALFMKFLRHLQENNADSVSAIFLPNSRPLFGEDETMDIAQLQNKVARLTAANNIATSKDFVAYAAGQMSEADLDRRKDERLQEIAVLEAGGDEWKRAVELEIKRESLLKKRLRWKRFSEKPWHTKPDDEIDYTKAERGVLCAIMKAAKGKRVFSEAYEYIGNICGASRTTVKRLFKKLEAEGLMTVQEQRIARNRNDYNRFTILCPKLLKWGQRHFSKKLKKAEVIKFREGVKTDLDLGTINGSCTTALENEVHTDTPTESKLCSNKAKRLMKVPPPEALQIETFLPVAKEALAEIGYTQPRDVSESEILDEIETLRDRYQPSFEDYWWSRFQFKHGKRRTALAFLETQILSRVRRDTADSRPWNEREVVRNKNGYLYGILKNDRDNCSPEITLGALLSNRQDCTLPASLMKIVEAHVKTRGGLSRSDSSAAWN